MIAETAITLCLSTHSQEIKKSEEMQIQNREEVGMELDDEVSTVEAGEAAVGLPQPGEIAAAAIQWKTQQETPAQPDAKRARLDSGTNKFAAKCYC